MREAIIARLTTKDDASACALAEQIISESRQSNQWVGYLDDFAALLQHPKSLVRNRGMGMLAANAQWDADNRFDAILPALLMHLADEKPITVRQCIKALIQVGLAKPQYIPTILSALAAADVSKYKDTMRPLIEKDMAQARELLMKSKAVSDP